MCCISPELLCWPPKRLWLYSLHNAWCTMLSGLSKTEEGIAVIRPPSITLPWLRHVLPSLHWPTRRSHNPAAFLHSPFSLHSLFLFSFPTFLPSSPSLFLCLFTTLLSPLFLFLPLSLTQGLKGSLTEAAEWKKSPIRGNLLRNSEPLLPLRCQWFLHSSHKCNYNSDLFSAWITIQRVFFFQRTNHQSWYYK